MPWGGEEELSQGPAVGDCPSVGQLVPAVKLLGQAAGMRGQIWREGVAQSRKVRLTAVDVETF